jgi:AAA15 family ATPase/GTPase
MAELLLDSLEIRNFRAFEHLKIEKLGRVNLIVGRNSIGKTALLEALWVYANRGTLNVLLSLLEQHKEFNFAAANEVSLKNAGSQNIISALEYLFYNVPKIQTSPIAEIGAIGDNAKKIVLEFAYKKRFSANNRKQTNNLNIAGLDVKLGNETVAEYSFDNSLQLLLSTSVNTDSIIIPNNFLQTSSLPEEDISELWNKIVVTDLETQVIKTLQLVNPDIERIAVVKDEGMHNIFVGFKKSNRRVTLASLGEGLNRVFQIALTLVNSENGLLLVDEIENGLYHGVQVDLWKLIFELAQRLNIQIFATTHSWDCVEAFEEAATSNTEVEGLAIRLQKRNDKMEAVVMDEADLEVVTNKWIEVR